MHPQKVLDEVKKIKDEFMIPDDDFEVYKHVFTLMDIDGSNAIDRACVCPRIITGTFIASLCAVEMAVCHDAARRCFGCPCVSGRTENCP